LLLYTDGITDLQNPAGEFFGMARLEHLLETSAEDYLAFLDHLLQDIETFAGGQELVDDCTAIVVDFHG
jgi:serine phosphatase RsbU (regulator of sigma subunit)